MSTKPPIINTFRVHTLTWVVVMKHGTIIACPFFEVLYSSVRVQYCNWTVWNSSTLTCFCARNRAITLQLSPISKQVCVLLPGPTVPSFVIPECKDMFRRPSAIEHRAALLYSLQTCCWSQGNRNTPYLQTRVSWIWIWTIPYKPLLWTCHRPFIPALRSLFAVCIQILR